MEKWIPLSEINYNDSMESFVANIIRTNKDLDSEGITVYLIDQGTITKELETLSAAIDLYPKDLKTVLRVNNSKSDRYYYDSKMYTAFPDVCKCYDRLLGITE